MSLFRRTPHVSLVAAKTVMTRFHHKCIFWQIFKSEQVEARISCFRRDVGAPFSSSDRHEMNFFPLFLYAYVEQLVAPANGQDVTMVHKTAVKINS